MSDEDDLRKILIPMIRRTIPSMMANDIIGVQPMTAPTGLIYSMRARYGSGVKAFDANTFDDWVKRNGYEGGKQSVDRYIEELENM